MLVHDAARPLVTDEVIERLVTALSDGWDGAVPALPIPDAVKRVEGEASGRVDRSRRPRDRPDPSSIRGFRPPRRARAATCRRRRIARLSSRPAAGACASSKAIRACSRSRLRPTSSSSPPGCDRRLPHAPPGAGRVDRAHGRRRRALRRASRRARDRRDRLHRARLLLRTDACAVVDALSPRAVRLRHRAVRRGGCRSEAPRPPREARDRGRLRARPRGGDGGGAGSLPVGLRPGLDPLPRRPRDRCRAEPRRFRRRRAGLEPVLRHPERRGTNRALRLPRAP